MTMLLLSVYKDLSAEETLGVTFLLSMSLLIECWQVPIVVAQIILLITPSRCDLKPDFVSAP